MEAGRQASALHIPNHVTSNISSITNTTTTITEEQETMSIDNTVTNEELASVTGGADTMPRSQSKDWLKACGANAYYQGMMDQSNGQQPRNMSEENGKSLAACNEGVAQLLRGDR